MIAVIDVPAPLFGGVGFVLSVLLTLYFATHP